MFFDNKSDSHQYINIIETFTLICYVLTTADHRAHALGFLSASAQLCEWRDDDPALEPDLAVLARLTQFIRFRCRSCTVQIRAILSD
jgi:hypothetical protein